MSESHPALRLYCQYHAYHPNGGPKRRSKIRSLGCVEDHAASEVSGRDFGICMLNATDELFEGSMMFRYVWDFIRGEVSPVAGGRQ